MLHGVDTTFLVQVEVANHPQHQRSRAVLDRILADGDQLAIAPQVLAEFIHVVTDQQRFEKPLGMSQAIERAHAWWNAREVTPVIPDHHATLQFLAWMKQHRLGRKRILDTLLAATYQAAGIGSILTTNARDFQVYDCFDIKVT